MHQVFISYSRKDISFVRQLAKSLEASGFTTWWDTSGLQGGTNWTRTIQKALQDSGYCIVVLSPDAVESEWVEREYTYAIHLKLKIIPLLYRASAMPMPLINVQYIDFQDSNSYSKSLALLINTLTRGQVIHASTKSWKKGLHRFLASGVWQGVAGILAILALIWSIYTYFIPSTPTQEASAQVATPATLTEQATPTDLPVVSPTNTPEELPTDTPTGELVSVNPQPTNEIWFCLSMDIDKCTSNQTVFPLATEKIFATWQVPRIQDGVTIRVKKSIPEMSFESSFTVDGSTCTDSGNSMLNGSDLEGTDFGPICRNYTVLVIDPLKINNAIPGSYEVAVTIDEESQPVARGEYILQ